MKTETKKKIKANSSELKWKFVQIKLLSIVIIAILSKIE